MYQPALAVTTKCETSLVMSVAVIAVTAFSNLAVAAIRHFIPSSIRIIVQMVIIASLVIVVDQTLQAFAHQFVIVAAERISRNVGLVGMVEQVIKL